MSKSTVTFEKQKHSAFSLIEVVVTMTILAIIVSFAAPSVVRTMEQSHADMAGASLRMINAAQRFYWLQNRTYAPDLATLINADLLDDDISINAPRYEFSVVNADALGFQAQARRRIFNNVGTAIYNGAWSGAFTIDETGAIVGTVDRQPAGTPQLTPAF